MSFNDPIAAMESAILANLSDTMPVPGYTPIEAGHGCVIGGIDIVAEDEDAPDVPVARHYLSAFMGWSGVFAPMIGREGRVDVTIPPAGYRLILSQPPHKRRAFAQGFCREFWRQNARLFATRLLTEEDCKRWKRFAEEPVLKVYENI